MVREPVKIEVIIVAAGAGQRLNSRVPKALVLLRDKPLVSYSLKAFEAHPDVGGIVVVAPQKHLKAFERITRAFKKVRFVVAGGQSRADSVKCGLAVLSSKVRAVLVHDAARPFIDAGMISRLTAALKRSKAAIVGVPVKFTVKKVDGRTLNIQETPARELLWEAQTPQGFHKDILVKAHAQGIGPEATDDAVLVERLGQKVKMVMGSYRNIKVTTPEDLVWARQLLR
ncbi:MAG: 2-C-methyl-D-erythritol 4-phosphate cytidylyltransferase [Candidatus Omnitrophica bacterium]|nr:2-C-methyl-D-erythritol 4-phosphate cytidylyltransferase [Candidatus Omnitrophota bacterium]MDE2222319.1 2-C-methyl-D-erythritol 4-phosphate cytidylyltransferase [Candidatus Omnitrophota bacterium]